MPGFTYVPSAGMTGQKGAAAGVDKAPFLLHENPLESITKAAGLTDTEGLYYLRDDGSADDDVSAFSRPVMRIANPFGAHTPRAESGGSMRFVLDETGAIEFRPDTANPICLSPRSNYKGNTNALIFANTRSPSAGPTTQHTNAALDMAALSELRLPAGLAGRAALVPPLHDVAGNASWHVNQTFGFAFLSRIEKLTIAGAGTTVSSNAGLLPANAMLFAVAYYVNDPATTAGANLYDIGIGGDLTRFATALNSNAAGGGYAYDPTPFRIYSAATPIVITLDAAADNQFQISLVTMYLATTSAPILT